jgi:uncharacterized membrane protein
MKLKTFKKIHFYLFISVVGILLIAVGIYLLINAFGEQGHSEIIIKSILLFFWILFTISNFFLYQKEKEREKIK